MKSLMPNCGKTACLVLAVALTFLPSALYGLPAQPVPIPEDPSVAPQLSISGVGIGTAGYLKGAQIPSGRGALDFSDSALQVGAAQSLFERGGVGSMGLGWLTDEGSTGPSSGQYFMHQAFVDFQENQFEVLVGRSDNPTAHLVDFPTLRGDDLITLTNPLNPFSNGKNNEEHRYSNVGSITFNQQLKWFEGIHVQHLINSIDPLADDGINSFGITFESLGEPGLENFEWVPSWGIAIERVTLNSKTSSGLNEAVVGGTMNVNRSAVHRVEVAVQDIFNWGSDLNSLSSTSDSFEADANSVTASVRYLNSPFGRPASQIALTSGYKTYSKISEATSAGVALTAARRLGHGFDAVFQYQEQWRTASLAAVQSPGLGFEQKVEIGFAFNFDASLNEHIAPRRSLLNERHRFLED